MTDLATQFTNYIKKDKTIIMKEPKFINTGSTLLNLLISGKWNGGYKTGSLANVIGDSSAGKSFKALTMLACACANPEFKDYELIYDDAENRNNFDMDMLFDEKVAKRIKSPYGVDKNGRKRNSHTAEDFADAVASRLNAKQKMIYVLDSFDGLYSEADEAQDKKERAVREKRRDGKKVKDVDGSYRMGKPVVLTRLLREIDDTLSESESLLIIVSQAKDNIGFGYSTKSRAGGRALLFHATYEMWLSVLETIKRKEAPVGTRTKVNVTKSSFNGRKGKIDTIIYNDYGLDDITTNIDYLVEMKRWEKNKQTIDAKEFGVKGTISTIVAHIEKEQLEDKLSQIVEEVWTKFYDSIATNRQRRY